MVIKLSVSHSSFSYLYVFTHLGRHTAEEPSEEAPVVGDLLIGDRTSGEAKGQG